MTAEQRTAIARVLFDLIRADDVLDLEEIRLHRRIREKYRIDDAQMIAAQKTDFGAAIGVLAQLGRKEVGELLGEMNQLANADGECCQGEALMLMALQFCLDETTSAACRLVSTAATGVNIERGNIVYVESHFDEENNAAIQASLRHIANEFSLAGLEFVFIPSIARDFAEMPTADLQSVIAFLAPMLPADRREQIRERLCCITTKDFCEEFLVRRMSLPSLYDCEPSLLLQVSRTDDRVIYLQITLGPDVPAELSAFVDRYRALTLRNPRPLVFHRPSSRFLYSGFHRSLFDLLAYAGQDVESRILIDLGRRKIDFLDLGQELRLPPMQMAQYVFIIQQSLCGKTHELPVAVTSEARRKILNASFNRLYGRLGGEPGTDYDKNLTPNLSHIRRAINNIPQLDNRVAYLPERTDNRTLRVRLKPAKVFVCEDDRFVPMVESEKWNRNG